MRDAVGLADIRHRIAIDQHHVRQLARLDRADILIEAQRPRAADGRGAQRLDRRHAAFDEAPQLPVRGEPLFLAMRADAHRNAAPGQLSGFARRGRVGIILFRPDLAAHAGRLQLAAWDVLAEDRMLPDVGVRSPIRVRPHAAEGHHQSRRIADLALREEAAHVLVQSLLRNIVLERGVAIGDDRDVLAEQRSPLGDARQPIGLRSGDHLLALFAARLVVVLDALRALQLQPRGVRAGIGQAVDLGEDSCRLGAIDDFAGREDARREILADALIACRREYLRRRIAGIVDRRHPHREMRYRAPVLLRHQIVRPLRAMRMRIDQSGDDRLARDINRLRARRHRDIRADRDDAIVAHHHRAALDNAALVIRHRHDARIGEGDCSAGLVRRRADVDRYACFRRREPGVGLADRAAGDRPAGIGGIDHRPQRPVELAAAMRPLQEGRPALA